jgi:predicted nucleotidyltransferase
MRISEDKTLQVCLEHIAQKHDVASLWLYGSRAKGNYNQASDYDLAVRFAKFESNPMQRQLRLQQLQDQLQRVTKADIQIVDIDLAPVPLSVTIIDEGKLLLDNTPGDTPKYYQQVWSKWEDYQYQRGNDA